MTCPICAHVEAYGHTPADFRGSHCECHRTWTASKEAHCMGTTVEGVVCHQHFSTDTLADKHRKGDHCMTPAEMRTLRTKTGKQVFRECETAKGKLWRNAESLRLSAKPAFLEQIR